MGVNTKELLLGMICTGRECMAVVRRFERDVGRLGEGCGFEEGYTGERTRRECTCMCCKMY